jgi:hypothetical protein
MWCRRNKVVILTSVNCRRLRAAVWYPGIARRRTRVGLTLRIFGVTEREQPERNTASAARRADQMDVHRIGCTFGRLPA